MGEEQKNETKNGKILGKKRGIIGVAAAAVLAMIVGLTIYATPAGRIARQLDLGQKYLAEQDYEQAVIAFNKAIEIDPMDVDAYIGLAAAYEGLGDMERAVAVLEWGDQITGSPALKEQLVETYLVQAKEKAREQTYTESLTVFDRLLELDSENSEVIDALSKCLNEYLAVLMTEQKYDEVKALAEKYANVAASVDFNALLEQIKAIEEEARLAKEAAAKQAEDTEKGSSAEDETKTAEEPKEASQETSRKKQTAQEPVVQEIPQEPAIQETPQEEQTIVQDIPQVVTSGEVIVWKEKVIERAVREYLGKPKGDIYTSEVAGIRGIALIDGASATFLEQYVPEPGIIAETEGNLYSLEDLKHFVSLDTLNLHFYSTLSDISALREMTNLRYLTLENMPVSDFSTLSGLINLQELRLSANNISDISALSSLTNLQGLGLSYNNISDISALGGLTNLQELYLCDNNISDISALSGLTNLVQLNLDNNNISDISALSGLTNLLFLNLYDNPITDYSPVSFMPEYENR